MNQVAITRTQWQPICQRSDLVANSGVCALMGDASSDRKSIALFFIPGAEPQLYAIDNRDPFSNAGVIARGIVAEVDGQLTVASPLYKQHFRLGDGVCLEDETVKLDTYPIAFDGDTVLISTGSENS